MHVTDARGRFPTDPSRRAYAFGALVMACLTAGCFSGRPAVASPVASPVAWPERVRVHLRRRMHVGERARVVVLSERRQVTRTVIDGVAQPDQGEASHTELEAALHVLAVDAHGCPSRSVYSITRLVRGDRVLLDGGREVAVTAADRAEDVSVTLDGNAVEAPMPQALGDVLSFGVCRAMTEDDLFGTEEPRTVGTSWAVEGSRVGALLRTPHVSVGELHGEGRLVRRFIFDRTDAIEVSGAMCGGIAEVSGLPSGLALREGGVEVRYCAIVPVDVDLPARESDFSVGVTLQANGRVDGHYLPIGYDMQTTKHRAGD